MTTRDPTTSAIVLAGGRSSRFGSDKLVATAEGRTLLQCAVDAVTPVCDEVIVVAAHDGTLQPMERVRLVRDATPFPGPLAGLVEGARAARGTRLLAVGADMPSLVAGVLQVLVGALSQDARAATLRADQPLPMALDRAATIDVGTLLLERGERSLRALPRALQGIVLPLDTWRTLDPAGLTLRDVDRPADLDHG
jgi:molybdopterin-guanine dinucleotide biosynthesis protein A